MLPHKTGKLAVFSVELQNADPVLDFLQKHFTPGQPVICKHSIIWNASTLTAVVHFYIQMTAREEDGYKHVNYLISPPQNSDFNLWFFSDLLKLKITVWWINFNLTWLLYISIYEFHEFTSILFIILGFFLRWWWHHNFQYHQVWVLCSL